MGSPTYKSGMTMSVDKHGNVTYSREEKSELSKLIDENVPVVQDNVLSVTSTGGGAGGAQGSIVYIQTNPSQNATTNVYTPNATTNVYTPVYLPINGGYYDTSGTKSYNYTLNGNSTYSISSNIMANNSVTSSTFSGFSKFFLNFFNRAKNLLKKFSAKC